MILSFMYDIVPLVCSKRDSSFTPNEAPSISQISVCCSHKDFTKFSVYALISAGHKVGWSSGGCSICCGVSGAGSSCFTMGAGHFCCDDGDRNWTIDPSCEFLLAAFALAFPFPFPIPFFGETSKSDSMFCVLPYSMAFACWVVAAVVGGAVVLTSWGLSALLVLWLSYLVHALACLLPVS